MTPVLDADVFSVLDLNGDGQLDLVGVAGGQPVSLLGRGTKGYHWQVMRPRAQPTAGDQRINSFGVGGEIEIRSGLLTQKQMLTGAPVHFGLGTRTGIDVARIFWPNGIMQADFDRRADQVGRRRAAPQGFVSVGVHVRRRRHALRDRFSVALAAWPAHQRAGHRGRDADGRLGEDSRRPARGEGRRLRRADHGRAVGNALRRSRVADGRGSSRR